MQGGEGLLKRLLLNKSRIILAIVILVVIIVGYNFLGRGFVDISVQTDGAATIQITDQKSGSVTSANTQGSVKKLLPRGDYLVLVRSGEKSFVQSVTIKGLLRTSKVSGSVGAEKSRTFVGTNPKSCYQYLNTVLVSYACDTSFDSAVIHTPATASLPSYTSTSNSRFVVSGSVPEGVKTTAGFMILGTNQSRNILYTLGDKLDVLALRELNIEKGKSYRLTAYGDSVVVYSTDLTKIYTLGVSNEETTEKSIDLGEGNEYRPRELVARGNYFAAVQQRNDEKQQGTKITILDSAKNTTKSWQFATTLGTVRFCGDTTLCVVDAGTLRVLDITKGSPKNSFVLKDVSDFVVNGSVITAISNNAIISVDTTSRTGQVDMSLSGFELVSIQESLTNFLLNVRDGKGTVHTLLVDRSKDDTTAIDRKVYALSQISGIESLSVYGNYIFFTSRSSLVFKQGFGFTYDEAQKKAIDDAINQKVTELQIDRSIYTIKNFANPTGEISE